MHDALAKDGLSPNVRRLVDLVEEIDFGTIENLQVRAGEPCFDPPPRVLRTIKLKPQPAGKEPRREGEIKDQTFALIRQLRRIGDGTVELIEVQAGLPFRLVLEQPQ